MGVSKNNGTPKSSILIGFSIINHLFWGTPIFGNIHVKPPPSFGKTGRFGWILSSLRPWFWVCGFLARPHDLVGCSETTNQGCSCVFFSRFIWLVTNYLLHKNSSLVHPQSSGMPFFTEAKITQMVWEWCCMQPWALKNQQSAL